MYFLHYIIPLVLFYFYRNKIMFWGLTLANLIDLDHVYYRIIGKVPWFGSACPNFWHGCTSLGVYPMHSFFSLILAALISIPFITSEAVLISQKKPRSKNLKNKVLIFVFWIGLGIIIHLGLDYLQKLIGFGI